MAFVLSSVSGNLISAASAGYAPTNSGDVSAIASAYQVVSATATQLYAGTAYVTSVNEAPLSATRAGNAANASLANSAWYDGTGRFISSLPDSATVSAIASSYAESAVSSKLDSSAASSFYTTANESGFVGSSYVDSAVSGKQDTITFGYDGSNNISSIDGSALAGGGGGGEAFPAYITTGTKVKAEITTGFQGSTSTRPTLFISGTPTSNAYPRILLSENHTAATCKSSTYLADAFEFYTGDPGSAGDKIFRADTAQVSASGRFVINSSYVSGAEGWRYGSSEYGQLTSTVDLVSTQSANWGGSALALSAGPGVKLEKVGNVLIASTDRTMLWSGDIIANQIAQLTQPHTAFEMLEIHHSFEGSSVNQPVISYIQGGYASTDGENKVIGVVGPALSLKPWESNNIYEAFGCYVTNTSATSDDQIRLRGARVMLNGTVTDGIDSLYHCYAIYGINRTAGV